jgi:hypothetical protein
LHLSAFVSLVVTMFDPKQLKLSKPLPLSALVGLVVTTFCIHPSFVCLCHQSIYLSIIYLSINAGLTYYAGYCSFVLKK